MYEVVKLGNGFGVYDGGLWVSIEKGHHAVGFQTLDMIGDHAKDMVAALNASELEKMDTPPEKIEEIKTGMQIRVRYSVGESNPRNSSSNGILSYKTYTVAMVLSSRTLQSVFLLLDDEKIVPTVIIWDKYDTNFYCVGQIPPEEVYKKLQSLDQGK